MWKPLKYRGEDYGEWFEINEYGDIKRLEYTQIGLYGTITFKEVIHKGKNRFNLVVKPLKIRKDIDVKRAVAENFLLVDDNYLYVHRYDESEGNAYWNLYWSNQKKVLRTSATYNVHRERRAEIDKDIIKAYLDGLTYKELTKKFDITRHYIRKTLDYHGIERPQVRNRANPNVDLDKMKEMFLSGSTLSDVASAFGISKYGASYYKGVLGLKNEVKILRKKMEV